MTIITTLKDFQSTCIIKEGQYNLEGKPLGLSIEIPSELMLVPPFNCTAYALLQGLRQEIKTYGVIEFPHLPVNKLNHTLEQKHPSEHLYSQNSFLTSYCQSPHQDTPPYPSAFWLDKKRQYSATWLMGESMCQQFYDFQAQNPSLSIDEIHAKLVNDSLHSKQAILVNQQAGLCLIDNSEAKKLYHARTALVDHLDRYCKLRRDIPMYAFNEVGLMQYIDTIDERRGANNRCETQKQAVLNFMQREQQAT